MNKELKEAINSGGYGTWEVTTEADVEGNSTTYLGAYKGYLHEIALFLANKAYYKLYFKPAKEIENITFTSTSVEVSVSFLSTDSGMRVEQMEEVLKPHINEGSISVENSSMYQTVRLTIPKDSSLHKELALQKARAYLSPEELKLLDLL